MSQSRRQPSLLKFPVPEPINWRQGLTGSRPGTRQANVIKEMNECP